MKIRIEQPAQLGSIVRQVRKQHRLRQDDTAAAVGVSENFLGKIENGGETIQWGKLLSVLHGLGIHVYVDVPPAERSGPSRPALRSTHA